MVPEGHLDKLDILYNRKTLYKCKLVELFVLILTVVAKGRVASILAGMGGFSG